MMLFRPLMIATLLLGVACPWAAQAQSYSTASQVNSRLNRLERDLNLLQRQFYRGEPPATSHGDDGAADADDVASPQAEVRLMQLEERLRDLTGRIEQNEFALQQLSTRFTKLEEDVDAQLGMGAPPPGVVPPEAGQVNDLSAPLPDVASVGATTPAGTAPAPAIAAPPMPLPPQLPAEGALPDDPVKLYNYAFSRLNQSRYDEAAEALKTFAERYPEHPLIGNVYYWLGETYYVQRNYVTAADQFRRGYEARPQGPKAADNLLKLGMTLSALNKNAEACVVFDQLDKAFSDASSAISQKTAHEKVRLGCKE